MNIDLDNRNLTGTLIVFVTFNSESFYCIGEVEYWQGVSWYLYVGEKNNVEVGFFEYLKRELKFDYSELTSHFSKVLENGDEYEMSLNKPKLYIDFDKKLFVSSFYEQELEEHILEGWEGRFSYTEIEEELIPKEYRYWEIPFA